VHRAEAIRLGDYACLYGSADYLGRARLPGSRNELLSPIGLLHRLDAAVDDLTCPQLRATMRESVTSTNVFVHVEATRPRGLAAAVFMADRHDD